MQKFLSTDLIGLHIRTVQLILYISSKHLRSNFNNRGVTHISIHIHSATAGAWWQASATLSRWLAMSTVSTTRGRFTVGLVLVVIVREKLPLGVRYGAPLKYTRMRWCTLANISQRKWINNKQRWSVELQVVKQLQSCIQFSVPKCNSKKLTCPHISTIVKFRNQLENNAR